MVNEVNLSCVTMSGLVTSVFSDSEYHNGFLIGEEINEEGVSFNIFGIFPFNFFRNNLREQLDGVLEDLGSMREKVVGIYRCRRRQGNRQISLNDFLLINAVKARLFCLIENDTSNYIRVEQTFFLCTRTLQDTRSLRMVPFKVWSISDSLSRTGTSKMRLHDIEFQNTDDKFSETILNLIRNNVEKSTDLLRGETKKHLQIVDDIQAILKNKAARGDDYSRNSNCLRRPVVSDRRKGSAHGFPENSLSKADGLASGALYSRGPSYVASYGNNSASSRPDFDNSLTERNGGGPPLGTSFAGNNSASNGGSAPGASFARSYPHGASFDNNSASNQPGLADSFSVKNGTGNSSATSNSGNERRAAGSMYNPVSNQDISRNWSSAGIENSSTKFGGIACNVAEYDSRSDHGDPRHATYAQNDVEMYLPKPAPETNFHDTSSQDNYHHRDINNQSRFSDSNPETSF